jgi:HAE1 family hydrophobic/amphiphilic exporter-1
VLPVALALGEGGEARAPMAVATMGGMITSTLLTLFLVPVVYAYVDRFGSKIRGKREKKGRTDAIDSSPSF